MKNAIIAIVLVFGFVGSSYAGDCFGGVCRAPLQPVRRVVTISKNIVLAPVRAVAVLAAQKSCTETVASVDACNCTPVCNCGSTSTKKVVKYQPLRRRLVNRSTTVSCCQ
jgi:hypothetical protein